MNKPRTILVFFLLRLWDLKTTQIALSLGGIEGNTYLRHIIVTQGFSNMTLINLILSATVIAVVVLINTRLSWLILRLFIVMNFLIVVGNILSIGILMIK